MNGVEPMASFPRIALMAAILAGACLPAVAQRPPVVLLEESIETTTDQVILPASSTGQVSLRTGRSLELDPDTQFIAAGKAVTLQEFVAFLRTVGTVPATIHYRLKDGIVSRIVVVGS
jgi:hypothetical protein